jgi:hypothetical protein
MNAGDVVLILILAGSFLIGFFQGVVRGLLGICAWAAAVVLGANLREPLGGYLAAQWTNFSPDYDRMLGFGIATVVVFVALLVVVQLWTTGPRGITPYPLVDDLVGGLLGDTLAILVIASAFVVLGTFYRAPDVLPGAGAAWTEELYRALIGSRIGSLIATNLVPFLGIVFGPLVPETVRGQMS